MRWPLLLLLVVCFASIANAVTVDITTYKDSSLNVPSTIFKDGDTVYFTTTNGVNCCESNIANLIYQGFPAINVEINDKGNGHDKVADDGVFTGKFVIGEDDNDADTGYVHVDENNEVLIYVALTTLSTGSFEVETDYQAPSPVNLNSELIGNTISLNWGSSNDNKQVVHYNIYRSNSPINEGNKQLLTTTTELSFVDNSITDGRTYYYAVSSEDQSGNIAQISNIEQLTTPDITSPSQVQAVTLYPKPDGELRIDWNVATDNVGVHRYIIYKDTVSNPSVEYIRVEANTFSEINDQHGMQFYYAIAAQDQAENIGAKSIVKSIIVDTLAPDQIFDLSAKLLDQGRVKLNWSAQIDADEYKLYISDNEDMSESTIIDVDNSTNYELTLNSQKHIAVTSLDLIGNEADFSNIVYVIPDNQAPEQITNFTAEATTDLRILLNWTHSNSSDLSHYELYKRSTIDFEFVATLENNSYIDNDVTHSTEYSYYLIAVDLVDNKAEQSQIVEATAKDLVMQLDVNNPINESTVETDMLIVSGTTKKGTIVNISNWNFNSRTILDDSGNFLGYINLREGRNRIKIFARDLNNNTINKTLIVYSELTNVSNNIIINQENYSIEEYLSIIDEKNKDLKNELGGVSSSTGLNKDERKIISDLTNEYMKSNLDEPISRAADEITLEALPKLGLDSGAFDRARSEVINSLSNYFKLNNKEIKSNLAQIDKSLIETEKKFDWSILIWIIVVVLAVLAFIKYRANHPKFKNEPKEETVKENDSRDKESSEKFDINSHLDDHMDKNKE